MVARKKIEQVDFHFRSACFGKGTNIQGGTKERRTFSVILLLYRIDSILLNF